MSFHRLHRRRRRRLPGQPVVLPSSNRAVSAIVQPKLRVSQPDDALEQEADAVANRVMSSGRKAEGINESPAGVPPHPADQTTLHRQCAECEQEDETQGLAQRQAKNEPEDKTRLEEEKRKEEEKIQPKRANTDCGADPSVTAPLANRIQDRRGSGLPLPGSERRFFEPRFGHTFSGVRVHTDPQAQQLAESIHARAFTVGQDIFFNRNEFRPVDAGSRKLMAHELTHTLQQGNRAVALQRDVQPGRVSCEDMPRSYPIFSRLGTTTPTQDIQQAVTRALTLLDNTIDQLAATRNRIINGAPLGWPTVNDTVAVSLREQLRIDPDDRTSWTGTGPRTVHQALRWYRNLRRFLNSDAVNYTCHSNLCSARSMAVVHAGVSRIHLCPSWWHTTLDEQAITLIHEAAHVYYATADSGRGLGSSYCMETFICRLHSLNVCRNCD